VLPSYGVLWAFPDSLFDAAAKVTTHFALGAFGIAAVVALLWMFSGAKSSPRRIPLIAWIVLILAIAIPTAAGAFIALSIPSGPYRVTAVVLDPDGIVVPDAHVTNNASGQKKQTNDIFEFEIPVTAIHPGETVTFYADRNGLAGQETIPIVPGRSNTVTIQLKKKAENGAATVPEPYKITTVVVDSKGTVIPDASVTASIDSHKARTTDVAEFEISPEALPPDRKVTFFAEKNGTSAKETVQLGRNRTASVTIKLSEGPDADAARPIVESTLTAGGFTPPNLGPQIPGCECGPSTIAINPLTTDLKTGEWGQFTWDSHWICQGQGLRNNDGNVSWDARTVDKLPDSYGTAKFRFRKPGAYSVNLDYSAVCLDRNNGGSHCWPGGNFCKAIGTARVIVK
jgi:hypothetical protein